MAKVSRRYVAARVSRAQLESDFTKTVFFCMHRLLTGTQHVLDELLIHWNYDLNVGNSLPNDECNRRLHRESNSVNSDSFRSSNGCTCTKMWLNNCILCILYRRGRQKMHTLHTFWPGKNCILCIPGDPINCILCILFGRAKVHTK